MNVQRAQIHGRVVAVGVKDFDSPFDVDPELGLLLSGREKLMRLVIDVRIDAKRRLGLRRPFGRVLSRQADEVIQLLLGLDIEVANSRLESLDDLAIGLADTRKDRLARIASGLEHPVEFATTDKIEATAGLHKKPQDVDVGAGLDREANGGIETLVSLLNLREMVDESGRPGRGTTGCGSPGARGPRRRYDQRPHLPQKACRQHDNGKNPSVRSLLKGDFIESSVRCNGPNAANSIGGSTRIARNDTIGEGQDGNDLQKEQWKAFPLKEPLPLPKACPTLTDIRVSHSLRPTYASRAGMRSNAPLFLLLRGLLLGRLLRSDLLLRYFLLGDLLLGRLLRSDFLLRYLLLGDFLLGSFLLYRLLGHYFSPSS